MSRSRTPRYHSPPPLPVTAPVVPFARLLACLLLPLCAGTAFAAPYTPGSDDQVVETLPLRRTDPQRAQLQALRAAAQARPHDADAAVALARQQFALALAQGDPRFVGHAQAALARWWQQPAPPQRVRVMRAILQQYNHGFAEALADLNAVVQADPADAEAWAWLAAIHMVQARYADARRACEQAAPHTSALLATACSAYVDSLTGRAGAAAQALRDALRQATQAPAAERLWALTRLAETEELRGQHAAAEAAYREALALDLPDNYLLCAYADFLLDRGRAAEVMALLNDQARADTLLLRLALAAKSTGAPQAGDFERDLAARFEAARRRGDTTHQKEEARFALGVQQQPARALQLAQDNYALQREPADARIVLQAALAARQPEAAGPVLKWMHDSGIESVALRGLAERLKELPR
ncbi:MAG: tetratricopeptide repeat protein [Pseudomonadota bacterium]